ASPTSRPARCSDVTAAISNSGWRSRIRSSSRPVYPLAPTTATFMRSLPFGELETRARAALTVLLALLLARVAGQEPALLERGAVGGVEQLERARDAVAQRVGLAGDPAAVQSRGDVVAPDPVHGLERLVDDHARRFAREVVLERAPVDAELPAADPQAN